jgi:hypothetical protein
MPSTPKGYRMTMFCEEPDAHSTLWEGARTGTDAAVRKFGADDVSILLAPSILSDSQSRPIHLTNYPSKLRSMLTRYSHVYLDSAFTTVQNEKAYSITSTTRRASDRPRFARRLCSR